MSYPAPDVSTSPLANVVSLPPQRLIWIDATDGTGPGHAFPTNLTERSQRIDYASGALVGVDQSTCNHTTGLSFNIRAGTNFGPVMLGFKLVTKTGGGSPVTTQGTPVQLSTTPTTYPWVDTSGTSYVYRNNFHTYHKV